jgi:hypothetical protein
VGRLSPERASVARSVAQPALHRSVQLDLSPERVSVVPSVAQPALHQSVQLDLSPERVSGVPSVAQSALHRSVQLDLSPERVSAVPSVAQPALHRSVQLDLSPERASVARSVAQPALHRSVQLDLSPEGVTAARSAVRPALARRASGVESDKRGWLGALLEGRHQPQCTATRGDDVPNELRVYPLLAHSGHPWPHRTCPLSGVKRTSCKALFMIQSGHGCRSERVPGRLRCEFEVADIGAEPQSEA